MADRTTELEIKVSFLEKTVGDLDDVIVELREKVHILTTEVARLVARAEAETRERPPANERPPHY